MLGDSLLIGLTLSVATLAVVYVTLSLLTWYPLCVEKGRRESGLGSYVGLMSDAP